MPPLLLRRNKSAGGPPPFETSDFDAVSLTNRRIQPFITRIYPDNNDIKSKNFGMDADKAPKAKVRSDEIVVLSIIKTTQIY